MSSPWSDDLVPGGVAVPSAAPSGPVGLSGVIAALVIVVLLGILAIPVSSFARGAHSFWPAHWDPRIAPIAARDERLRGLNYSHAVGVRFLSEKAFVKLVGGGDTGSAPNRAEIGREAATFRALGLIGGKVDLFKAAKQVDQAGTLAFYDFNTKEIVIRGTKLDVSHRATLAHELTHVLQDQHFDIGAINKRAEEADKRSGGSAEAMLALIEGDANNVTRRYMNGLPTPERNEYDREQRAQGTSIGKASAGVPSFVELAFSAPYDLGPLTIRMLIAGGGNAAVNAALTGPIPTTADFVQAGLVSPPPPDLAVPEPRPGERAEGPSDAFGAFELYLMLASRLDAVRALAAADAVEGGRAQGYRNNGTYCYRATLEARDVPAASMVADSVRSWEASATGAAVSRAGSSVTFTACDPGSRAVGPSTKRLTTAELLLAGRSGVAVGAAEKGVPPDAARCIARLFMRSPGALSILKRSAGGSLAPADAQSVRTRVQQDARTCHDDPQAGLL